MERKISKHEFVEYVFDNTLDEVTLENEVICAVKTLTHEQPLNWGKYLVTNAKLAVVMQNSNYFQPTMNVDSMEGGCLYKLGHFEIPYDGDGSPVMSFPVYVDPFMPWNDTRVILPSVF